MQKYGAEFLKIFDHAKVELTELSQTIYTPRDVAAILSALGTKMELFFKSVLFPSESPWKPFKHFLNCLVGVLDGAQMEVLHNFREVYNLARHNPRLGMGVMELREVIERVEPIMAELVALNIGRSNEVVSVSIKRMYWVVAWEHFDDAEVHIIVPSSEDVGMGPPELDLIHLEIEDWQHAKQLLATTGQLNKAEGNVPAELIEVWNQSRSFIEVVCFEGEYRELLTSLARFESRSMPIPGIHRADCSQCVLVACLVAFVDVFSSLNTPGDIVQQVTRQIVSNYAMNSSAVDLAEITKELVETTQVLWERGDAVQVVGPLWASNEEFKRLREDSIIESEKYLFMIDDQYRLIALHS